MQRILAIFLFLLLSPLVTNAQYWDKAPELIQTYTKEDTTRLRMLYQMMQYNNMRHFKDNRSLLEEAAALTEKLNLNQFKARLTINKAEQRILEGNYKEALEALLPAFDLLEKYPNAKDQIHAYILLSEIDRENNDWVKAVNDLIYQIEWYSNSDDYFGLGWLHLTLANVYLNYIHEDYERFLNTTFHLEKAQQYFEKISSKTGIALVKAKYARYNKNNSFRKGVGVNEKKQSHEKAITYANESLEVFYALDQAQNIAYALYQKATSYSIMGNHEASVPVYEEAVSYYEQDGNLIWLKRLHQHLFVAFSILGNQDKALAENKKFILIKDSIFGIEKRLLLAEAETKFNTQKIKAAKEKAELKS